MVRSIVRNLSRTLFVFVLSGCDSSKPAPSGGPSPSVPDGVFVAKVAEKPIDVSDAKKASREGEEVVIHGRIGGSKSPFVAERAMFTLADMRMPPCNANPDDKCPDPWDYCCEPKDKLLANTLTAQLTGPDGKPLKLDLNGVKGLKPLAEVIVAGRVASKSEQSMVVNIARIEVKPAAAGR